MLSTIQNVKPVSTSPPEPQTTDVKKEKMERSSEDAGRRKQRNPKPCFPSSGQEAETKHNGSGPPDSPQDLSSMVKVEMLEGEAASSAVEQPEEQRKSPSKTVPPPLTPMPHHLLQQSRAPVVSPVQQQPGPEHLLLSASNLDQMHAAARQNNLFHFGDVSVSNHPDTQPVPMVIPMVYLYPLSEKQDKGK